MDDVLGYEGTKVVVTGAASGMGAATAGLLVELGADVHALDVQPTDLAGATARQVDLKDQASIDAAVAAIGADVQAVFSVAGLPGPPFSDLDTMTVNFVGRPAPHRVARAHDGPGAAAVCVASNAGLGWQQEIESWMPLVQTPDFDDGLAWCEANPDPDRHRVRSRPRSCSTCGSPGGGPSSSPTPASASTSRTRARPRRR